MRLYILFYQLSLSIQTLYSASGDH